MVCENAHAQNFVHFQSLHQQLLELFIAPVTMRSIRVIFSVAAAFCSIFSAVGSTAGATASDPTSSSITRFVRIQIRIITYRNRVN